jgi:hypothetical protein
MSPSVRGTVTTYTASSLPSGLRIDAATGIISGTPTGITSARNYIVAASNAFGSTCFAVNITVQAGTKQTQTITFEALGTKTMGDAPFTLSATASSGLAVSFVSSNTSVATISGNMVTIVGTGTTTIVASQAGDDSYYAADNVSQTLVVNPPSGSAPSNLSYNNPVVCTVNTVISPLSPSVTGTVTSYTVSPALPAGLSINATTGVISGMPTAVTAAANYTITATNALGSTTFVINIKAVKKIDGDTNGNGTIDGNEIAGDTNGNGTIDGSEVLGDLNGDGMITEPEAGGDANGNGVIDGTEKYLITILPTQDWRVPLELCENSDGDLEFRILSGTPSQYKIIFDEAALVAGFKNVDYTKLDDNGVVTFRVIDGTPDGTYHGTLKLRNSVGAESTGYPFLFTVDLGSRYIIPKFDDVVLCDNSSDRFTAYQWYKNGVAIAGATKQFYCDPNGLVGLYSVEVTNISGQKLKVCGLELNIPTTKKVSIYPNPVDVNQTCTVELNGFEIEELEGAVLSIFNSAGSKVYSTTHVTQINSVKLPFTPGVYVGHVTSANGTDRVFKVIVK